VLDRLGGVYDFAAERHAGKTRPAGQSYVQHLLHDVVEHTPTTADEVEERFGPEGFAEGADARARRSAQWFDQWQTHYAYLAKTSPPTTRN
jgi:(p)ppGpp synthase/HD superfamily hydrolase